MATYRGGNGPLELAATYSTRDSGSTPSTSWVIGKINNADGVTTGEIITSMHPWDIISDAFKQELTAAGYQINFSKAPTATSPYVNFRSN